MAVLPSKITCRFGVLLLLSVGGFLGSCRSERLAFEFQPAADKLTDSGITQPLESTRPATIQIHSTAVVTPCLALPQHQLRMRLSPSGAYRKKLLLTHRVVSIHQRPMMLRAASNSLSRHSPHGTARSYEGSFYAGLISAGIGLLSLITSLILPSGLLALVGLGALLLGLFLAVYGLYGDGNYKT